MIKQFNMTRRLATTAAIVSSSALLVLGSTGQAATDYLVKMKPGVLKSFSGLHTFTMMGQKAEAITGQWVLIKGSEAHPINVNALRQSDSVEYVQPNYAIHLIEDYRSNLPLSASDFGGGVGIKTVPADNPAIPALPTNPATGTDPMFSKQWGMNDIGVADAWKVTLGSPEMVTAVLDTGVDYTHEDLNANLWRNPGEMGTDSQGRDKSSNQVDDEGNGYVDDVIGWDFAANDNKPFDLAVEPMQLLMGGGNPGHGTHCAGNVAAAGGNGIGIAGVAPHSKVMAIRFMNEKGEGDTATALKAIKYAVDNGARILSNSWGSEGEDAAEADQNKALREIIDYARDHNVLFIAAAGNGHQGAGYDNDTDPKPGYPASYENESIVSVAAIGADDKLGAFSNWGMKSVDLAAPGVKVFSTTVGGNYSDTVIDILGITAYWDGTSMATPHVAGAAALYWSAHPQKNWKEVKAALLESVKKVPSCTGKMTSEGKLDVRALMQHP